MYYYVLEQVHSSTDRKLHEKIKFLLSDLGISGDFCTASPARSAEELVDMGLRRGVSTIVAVGSERHINHIVNVIKTMERGLHRNVVLGVVPTDKESSLRERLRLSSIEEACEALKYRRFTSVDIGYLEGVAYFLTSAELNLSRPSQITIKADRWETTTSITHLTIFSDLTFSFYNAHESKGAIDRWVSWLVKSGDDKESNVSIFRARTVRVSGEAILPVLIEGEVVAKTPVVAYKMPKALKLIIKRDRFVVAKKEDQKEPG